MESPKAIPQGEGLREQTESTTSNYFCLPFFSFMTNGSSFSCLSTNIKSLGHDIEQIDPSRILLLN